MMVTCSSSVIKLLQNTRESMRACEKLCDAVKKSNRKQTRSGRNSHEPNIALQRSNFDVIYCILIDDLFYALSMS